MLSDNSPVHHRDNADGAAGPDDGSNVMDTMGMIDTSFDNVAGFGSFGGASNISMDTSPSTLFASGFRPGEDLGQHQMNDGQGKSSLSVISSFPLLLNRRNNAMSSAEIILHVVHVGTVTRRQCRDHAAVAPAR